LPFRVNGSVQFINAGHPPHKERETIFPDEKDVLPIGYNGR
jgi:hypothetical protein